MPIPKPLFALLFLSTACLARGADVKLHVHDIGETGGTLNWILFDSAEAYKSGEGAVASGRHRVTGDAVQVTLHDLPAGTYAVRLFNDENNNGELDTNLLGIPREGYGFSNNAGARGPATFDDAAIKIEGDTTVEIRVR